VKPVISRELAGDFEGKREELDAQDKTYCSEPACSTFIGAHHTAADTSTATCPACQKLTCTMCKGASHPEKCPADSSLQATLSLATEQGWQRCRQCGRMIEMIKGCVHIP
jgi:hypothetical protein